jgi:uncharacterized protein YbbC (DUF1343 family)
LEWRPPSPAITSPECALLYSGTCLFEGTNISEGRGTSSPFRVIGAPWLNADLLKHIDERWLTGCAISPQKFTPRESKYSGETCIGFAIDVVDKETANPVALSAAMLMAIAARHRSDLEWNEMHFDAVAGTNRLRHQICTVPDKIGKGLEDMFSDWDQLHREFETLRSQYVLYEG